MADEERDGTTNEGGRKAGKKGGLFGGLSTAIIIVAAVVLASALSAVLAVTFLGRSGPEKADVKEEKPAEPQFGPTQDLGSFTVNVADSAGNYIKAGVAVEAESPEVAEELTMRQPQVKDAIVTVLGQQTMDAVSSTEGKAAVKKKILTSINRFMTKGKVKEVFFTEFVFQ